MTTESLDIYLNSNPSAPNQRKESQVFAYHDVVRYLKGEGCSEYEIDQFFNTYGAIGPWHSEYLLEFLEY